MVERVDLAPVALASGEIGPELGHGVHLPGQLVEQLAGANRVEPAGWTRWVEAFEVELALALGGPVGEELANEQPALERLHLEPVADVVAGVGVGAEDHVDATLADVGQIGAADVDELGDAPSAEAVVHQRHAQVAQRVDAAGEAVGVAQVHRSGHVHRIGIVLAHFERVHPAQLGVFGVVVLHDPVVGPKQHPQMVAQALGLLRGICSPRRVEHVVSRLLEAVAQPIPRSLQFIVHAVCLAAAPADRLAIW